MLQGVQTMIADAVPGIDKVIDATDHSTGENPYYTRVRGSAAPCGRRIRSVDRRGRSAADRWRGAVPRRTGRRRTCGRCRRRSVLGVGVRTATDRQNPRPAGLAPAAPLARRTGPRPATAPVARRRARCACSPKLVGLEAVAVGIVEVLAAGDVAEAGARARREHHGHAADAVGALAQRVRRRIPPVEVGHQRDGLAGVGEAEDDLGVAVPMALLRDHAPSLPNVFGASADLRFPVREFVGLRRSMPRLASVSLRSVNRCSLGTAPHCGATSTVVSPAA